MNTRERFHKVMHWEKPDRVPNMDFGYWEKTFEVWHEQGLPNHITTHKELEEHLDLEGTARIEFIPAKNGLFPAFEEEVLEDKGKYKIIRNEEGVICKVSDDVLSIPQYVRFPLETREDWEALKNERLDYTREDRIGDVKKKVEQGHAAGFPVRFDAGSLYGWLRNWMGLENLSIALMTEKAWVEEMMEHLTEMTIHLAKKTLPGADVDLAWWWEDMCFNHGPLLSPKLFRELMVPRYKRITNTLKSCGIDVNVLDCDGRIYELTPYWLDAGINCMFPIEAAHTNPLRLREEHGERALLMGGVDKVQLIKGKEAIDWEIERLHPLVEKGGFIPTVDHRVPPDVTYENYLYYLEKKKEIL